MRQKTAPIAMTITPEARPYLLTLRRIPADVRLSMATREIEPGCFESCLCGWALRDAIFSQRGDAPPDEPLTDAEYRVNVTSSAEVAKAAEMFGGTTNEWLDIYWDITDDGLPLVEEAFLIAVAEAAEGRRLVK
jgi:hypothetical protein